MKSESDFIEALILSQSLSSCQPGPLSTFPFTQLSTAHVCFTEQIVWAAKLNATCKIECVQHPPGFLEEEKRESGQWAWLTLGSDESFNEITFNFQYL